MSNEDRFTRKGANSTFRSYALLLIIICSLGLVGCSGLVTASSPGTPNPLSVSGVQALAPTTSSFQVDWSTNIAANSAVDYGTSASYGSSTPVNSSMVTSHQVALSGLAIGTLYHFRVRSTDANNVTATSGDVTFATTADTTPPTVSITSPAANATLSGNVNVDVTATDNVAVQNVQLKIDNANYGAAVASGPYVIPVNTGTLSNGNHILTAVATDTSNNSATSSAVTVKVNNVAAIPSITSLSPTSGVVGTSVTINGANFGATQGTSTVTFGGVAAATTSWSATSIVAPVPAGATTGNVVVTVGGAASNGLSFTVTVPSPSISSLNPTSGAVGTSVTISGANFGAAQGSSTVKFNGTTATASSWSATSIMAPVPAGATTGNVVVTVGGAASNGVSFTVQADTTPPTVPTGLTATALSSSQINLSWTASTDNVGVTGYNIYRGGIKIGTAPSITYQDTGLAASTSYTYNVSAFDAAGNTSAQSAAASATTLASGGGLPNTLGWYQIPNTLMINVCPPGFACQNIIPNWNGGVADTARNRLIVWGGGHTDYGGNEVYALDLNNLTFVRLNNPSPANTGGCVDALSDGKPNSRHTYAGLSYVPGLDEMVATGGSLACSNGTEANDLWTLSMANLQWTKICGSGNPCGYNNGLNGKISAYDPNTKNVYIDDRDYLYAFNTTSQALSRVTSLSNTLHTNAEIDPVRKRMYVAGDGAIYYADIDPSSSGYGSTTNIALGGCSSPAGSVYPGMAYDPVRDKMVLWSGGNTIYEITLSGTTPTCSANTSFGGGPGAQQGNGTHGRFRYFPSLGVFALVNDASQNAWALRVSSSGSGGSGPSISAISVSAITTTGATITWTTDVAATSQVEYGTTTAYGSVSVLNSTLVTSHSQLLAGLTAGTLYHYRVHSKNSAGVESISADAAFSTNSTIDTTPPTVSMTAPTSGATVSGSVAVSANASDNVGVASVQFMLDGGNLGSALTSSPYQISWDTTTAANGAHALTAVARDAAGNTATAVPVSVTVSNQIATGELPLATRCADPGVTVCLGLDKATDLTYTGSNGVVAGNQSTAVLDTATKPADGSAGSLKFTVTAAGDQNSAGNFTHDFGGAAFDTGQAFYVQFRMRSSDGFAQNYNAAGEKHFIMWHNQGGGSCTDVQFVMINTNYRGFPQFYQSCSPDLLANFADGDFGLEFGAYNPPADPTAGNGGYLCSYRRGTGRDICASYPANNWQTYYIKVTPGTWGQANTRIEAWVAYEGQNMRKFFDKPDITFTRDSTAKLWGRIDLLPYDTGRSATVANAMNVWYAGLIVSRNPIPPPTGPTP
jgi:hypothetical protein